MKKLIMLGAVILFMFLGVVVFEDRASADEGEIKILFELNAKDGFNEEIRIKTRNLETKKRYGFSFAKGSDYSSFLRVPPGDYSLEVEFQEGSVYTSNAQETYHFEKEGQTVTFDLFLQEGATESFPTYVMEGQDDPEIPMGAVYAEVKHPIYVYNDFLNRFSYIEDDEYLNSFKGLFNKASSAKRIFLMDNAEHTEEMYDNMSGYEEYIWKMILFWPKEDLKQAPYSFEKYLESSTMLSLMKKKFVDDIKPGYEGKEEAYYALEEVWRWYYDYYEKTGEIFDFEEQEWFSIETIAYIQEPSLWTDSDVMKVKLFGTELTVEAQEMLKESTEASSEVVAENTVAVDDEKVSSVVEEKQENTEKKTIFGVISDWLAVIAIIALSVAVILLVIKNKNKKA